MMRWLDKEGGLAEAVLTAVAALLLLCVIDLVRDRVAALPRYRVASNRVDLSGASLIVENYAQEICGTGPLLDRPRSLLDRELPRLACEALERSAWVRRVVRVRRRFPDALEIALEVRAPVGVVCAGLQRVAVDRDGVVLEHACTLTPPRVVEIRVPGGPPPVLPAPGLPCRDASVLEALEVLRELAAHAGHPALETVQVLEARAGVEGVRRPPGSSDLWLWLDNGVHVLWGRAPSGPLAALEPDTATKLDHLDRLSRSHPGFLGIARVDLRFHGGPEIVLAGR